MQLWLLKTEPTVYSYSDLERDEQTMWDGVTNALALKNLRQVKEGDKALIFHTGSERSWVGIADVVKGYYVNPEKDDPKLAVCDVKANSRLEKPVTLAQIKAVFDEKSDLVRLGRLSVVPITEAEWEILQSLAAK